MSAPEQRISRAQAETALVHLLLTQPGVEQAESTFLIDAQLYRIRIEKVTDKAKIKEIINGHNN